MAAAVVADVSPGPAETLIMELVSGMEAEQTDLDDRDDDSESDAEMLEILRQGGVVIAARCTDNESAHLREWVARGCPCDRPGAPRGWLPRHRIRTGRRRRARSDIDNR
jgi:hypothetical protein